MDRTSSKIGNTDNWRKPSKRKSYTRRRIPKDALINLAEARREIAYALHLHRLSSSSCKEVTGLATTTGLASIHGLLDHHHHHHHQPGYFTYSVMESLPKIPEPIWSTTPPSTYASPSCNPALEPELNESISSSSYTWWLGFLKDIDSKSNQQIITPPFEAAARNDQVMQSNCAECSDRRAHDSWDACNYNLLVDEWLVNPAAEVALSEVSSGKDS